MNQWLEEHRTLVLTGTGLLIVAGMVSLLIRWKPAAPIVVGPPLPTATPEPSATPAPIRVYVSGAVNSADVYVLAPDAIARDALAAAGGATSDADLDRVNLAQPLHDGEHIHVPRIGETPTAAPDGSAADAEPVLTGLVNINVATQEELELLPGIGPVIAQRIVEYRETYGPFSTIEAIQNVPGIGPAKFEDIRDWITTE